MVWLPARVDQHARVPAVMDGPNERRPWSFVGERLKWLARGRSGAADPEAGRVGRWDDAPRTPTADAPGRGVRRGGPAGLSLRAWATGVDQPARPASASGRWSAWLDQPCRRDSASGPGPRGSTSRPGGTHPLGVGPLVSSRWPAWNQHLGPGQRGWISRADGTQPHGEGRGGVDQPARRDLCSGCGGCGGDQVDRLDLGSGRGPAVVSRWTDGTWAPGAGAAGVDQVAWRDLGSERAPAGVDQGARRDLCSGHGCRGGGPAGPAGLVLRVRWLRGRPGGPAGLGLWAPGPRVWTRWPRGT